MKASHTPGPWKVRTLDGSIGTIETSDGELQIAQTQQLRADDRNTGHSERLANTALIAAAPELLYALQYIISDLPTNRDWLNPALERMARAAIAKATGC
jgi:hypothetical protein